MWPRLKKRKKWLQVPGTSKNERNRNNANELQVKWNEIWEISRSNIDYNQWGLFWPW